ncbi:MAG: zinc-binding dehydrogenase [Alphaproteobacteria bacterium]|nr:zinc-binding dehydrogenase [Alphaproteobacteria bacterium]
MKAVVLSENGVELADVDQPEVKPTQVLVKVASCSVNRSDLLTTQGKNYGHVDGAAKVMGAAFCGEVVEAGSEASGVAVGDRVMALGAGGWAEYAVADYRRTLPVPDHMDLVEGGAYSSALLTMHDAIVTNGEFQAGQTLLIQGASTGVGIMGLQIGKHLGASLVIGTSTNDERRARLAEFGADLALDSSDPSWVDQVLEATDGQGVDLIVDQISGYAANQNMSATKIHGRIINVGRLGGEVDQFDFNKHAERRLTYIGTTGRTRSIEEHAEVFRRAREDLWAALDTGKFRMPIDSTFDMSDANAALERTAANRHFGRIMLTVNGGKG